MVIYTCLKCNIKFNQKIDYTRHINRKTPCNKNKENQIDGSPHELSKVPHKLSQLEENEKDSYICLYCKNEFSNKYNLERHIKLYCKTKKQEDNKKEDKFNELIQRIETNEKNAENNNKMFEEKIKELENQLREEKEKNKKLNPNEYFE